MILLRQTANQNRGSINTRIMKMREGDPRNARKPLCCMVGLHVEVTLFAAG
jgi:hypothetical protein